MKNLKTYKQLFENRISIKNMITKFKIFESDKLYSEEDMNKIYNSYLNFSKYNKFQRSGELIDMINQNPDFFNEPQKRNINKNPLIFWAIYMDDIKIVKEIIKNTPNIFSLTNSNGEIPLFWAFDDASYEMIKLFINDSDWSHENDKKEDFIDYMNNWSDRYMMTDEDAVYYNELKDIIIKDYPEKYQDYLRNKKAKEFNL